MKDPIILRRNDTLSLADGNYWKDLFFRTLKIGTEIEAAPAKGKIRQDFEKEINDLLRPSGTYDLLGQSGVVDVSPEHCGIEIRVIGRQPYFRVLQTQYLEITQALLSTGARARSTCGLHFHLITPTLAEPVPEIILANLWNFVRRYSPELRFLTSCGESRSALCRRRNYTSHIEMVRLSPIHTSMAQIQQELKQSAAVPEHQNFFNLQHLGFTESGAIFPFHLEFRFPDADLSATSITAKTFLFFAMLLKAVELSQYGVIHVGKITPWRRKIELLDLLSNNDGALATSDTSHIDEAAIAELRQGCHELLDLLEPVFDRFEDNPSLEVLQLLAETPISLLRSGGHDWQSIEALLSQRAQLEDYSVDEIELKLMQHIEFEDWGEAKSIEEWKWNAASRLFLTPHDLDAHLQRIEGKRGLRWNERLGTYVFNR